MTRERFIRIQAKRGYQIEELGKVVILRMRNYTAMWFFNEDGTLDEDNPPYWNLERPKAE